MRKWGRELTVRTMVCVICGDEIKPRTKVLVAALRGKIVLCKKCEKALKGRIEIDEEPMFKKLGGY